MFIKIKNFGYVNLNSIDRVSEIIHSKNPVYREEDIFTINIFINGTEFYIRFGDRIEAEKEYDNIVRRLINNV